MCLSPCVPCECPISTLATACRACGAPVRDDAPGCLSVILGLLFLVALVAVLL